jgi:hypothetical protein
LAKSNTFFFNSETDNQNEYKSSAGGSFKSVSEQLVGLTEEERLKIDLGDRQLTVRSSETGDKRKSSNPSGKGMSIKTGDSGTPRFIRDAIWDHRDQKATKKWRELNNLKFTDYTEIKLENTKAFGAQSSEVTEETPQIGKLCAPGFDSSAPGFSCKDPLDSFRGSIRIEALSKSLTLEDKTLQGSSM